MRIRMKFSLFPTIPLNFEMRFQFSSSYEKLFTENVKRFVKHLKLFWYKVFAH